MPSIGAPDTALRHRRTVGCLLEAVVVGPAGVRAGWRVLAFFALWLASTLVLLLAAFALGLPTNGGMWDPVRFLPMQVISLLGVVLASLVLARLEARAPLAALAAYGLPLRAGRRELCEGLGWGAAAMSVLVAAIWSLHGYVPRGLNLLGLPLIGSLVVWTSGFLLLGLSEELLFRAYPLAALRRWLGFWPAAVVLSLIFSAFHAGKDGENGLDLLSLVVVGLFACFTVQRTGAVWFAIGFHAAFNLFGLVVYSAPNGGELLPGRVLDAQFPGPAWLTGGSLGPEASLLVFPLFALLFTLFRLRFARWCRADHLRGGPHDRPTPDVW